MTTDDQNKPIGSSHCSVGNSLGLLAGDARPAARIGLAAFNVVMVLGLTLSACSWEVYGESLKGPFKLGGRTSLTLPKPFETPGLRRRLCFELPEKYTLDLHKRLVIAPNGDQGMLSARLKTNSGNWYSLVEFGQLGFPPTSSLCLYSQSLVGRMSVSFVELEIDSTLEWETPRIHWESAEKL